MKRTLVLLGALGLVASSFSTLISCGTPTELFVNPQHSSLNGLRLDVNFDDEKENNYNDVKVRVKQLIKKFNPAAKFNVDYEISKTNFNKLTGKLINAGYVEVNALPDSQVLTGSFKISVYKDLDAQIKVANLANHGTFNKGIAVKNSIQEMLDEAGLSDKNDIYYEFITDPNNPGSWTVRSVGTELIVKANFTFTQTMDAFDLTQLQDENLNFDVKSKTMEQVEQEVSDLIRNASINNQNIQQGVDYEVTVIGSPNIAGSKILVESLSQGEYLLANSFTIEVVKASITNFNINDYAPNPPDVSMTHEEILELIYAVLEYHFKNYDLDLNTDYEVFFKDDNWVEVYAKKESKYITGAFRFQLETK